MHKILPLTTGTTLVRFHVYRRIDDGGKKENAKPTNNQKQSKHAHFYKIISENDQAQTKATAHNTVKAR